LSSEQTFSSSNTFENNVTHKITPIALAPTRSDTQESDTSEPLRKEYLNNQNGRLESALKKKRGPSSPNKLNKSVTFDDDIDKNEEIKDLKYQIKTLTKENSELKNGQDALLKRVDLLIDENKRLNQLLQDRSEEKNNYRNLERPVSQDGFSRLPSGAGMRSADRTPERKNIHYITLSKYNNL